MKLSTLASRLVEAPGSSQRKKLLAENRKLADVRLARILKDECYRVWTSAPARARAVAAALKTLSAFSRSDEIDAMRFWVEGIADITSGKLEPAIANLDTASKLLTRLRFEHESAQPQVAKLIALAMLGRYDEARRAGEKALKIFERYSDQLAAGKIEMNLSNIVSRRDEYAAAERYCVSAYRRFKKLGEASWQAMAENGLANTYAELNDFSRAEKFYSRALETARAARMRVTVAEIEASMGNLALFRGRYSDALRWLELSRQKFDKLAMPHQSAIAELEIADIYAELNLSTEAIEIYRRLVPTLRRLKLRAEEARARANFGRALSAFGDAAHARIELKRAAKLFEAEKNSIVVAVVEIRLASLELSEGKLPAALELAESACVTLDAADNIRLRLSASWLQGEILARSGNVRESEILLRRALKEAQKFEQPAVAQAAMNSLGVLARDAGKAKRAEKFFHAALDAAEAARDPLPGEEFRMAFLAKTLEPYENLARLYLSTGDVEKALVTFERARSRSLLESVAGKQKRASGGGAKLREELNWYYSRLGRADDAETAKLQTEIRKREKQVATAELRSHSTTSRRAAGKARPEFDLAKLKKRLGGGKALVEFLAHNGKFSAIVVTNDATTHIAELAAEAEIVSLLAGLHFQFGALRFGAAALGAFAAELKSRADLHLRQLHEKLLAPIQPLIGERGLVIVPAGALNYVPFHALLDGDKYAIESRSVTYSPSAAVWERLNSRATRRPTNALLMAFADERIPLVNDEVARLARVLPNSAVLTGKRATFAAFADRSPKFDVVHLACHGQFRPDNPMFSSLHLADGWVTVRDATANRLRAELVTLSACETGMSKVHAGEEILGLARGFLAAGARSLLLTLWTVNDAAAARLMEDFYDNLQRGAGIAASLQIAQMNIIKRGEHPYYWSPFFVIG